MAIKRTYINADEELVIKGKLTIEGNVTQIESTQQVTNLEGNVFTINSDGDNTTAKLVLNSNGNLAEVSFSDGSNVVSFNKDINATNFTGSVTGNVSGTSEFANALTSAVTVNLNSVSGDLVPDSDTFTGSGNVVNLEGALSTTGVSAGTYGTSNDVAQITVDAKGRITTAIDVAIDHDALLNFVADEHVAHSGVTLTAGAGLTGGGDITASRTFDVVGGFGITVNANDIEIANSDIRSLFSASNGVDYNSSTGAFQAVESEIQHDSLDGFVADEHIAHSGVTLTAGTGLTGGGDITASRTFNVIGGDGITANANDIQVDSTVVRTTGTQTIAGDKTFTGNVDLSGATVPGFTVDGELSVTGNVNSLNYVDLQVQNSEIILNSNVATAQDAVIKNERGSTGNDTYLKWDEASDRWQFSNDGSTDNNMLLFSDFSASNGVDYNSSTGAFQAVESEIQHDSLDGFVANEHVDHSAVDITAGSGLTGGGDITTSRTLNVIGGDGITANANDIEVDSTVIRTTGDQSLAGEKTFTGKLILPSTDVTDAGAIFTDSNEAWVYVNGSKKQITPTASIGSAEEANSSLSYINLGTTGTSTYELYAGQRTVGSDTFHAIKGLESGTYTTISSTATALTIDGDISAIRTGFSAGGDLSYNSSTGEFTFTERTDSEVRGLLSGTGLISYNSGTGVISTSADNYASWNYDTDTGSSESVASGETVNILGGSGIDVTHSGKTITVTNTNDADITGVTAGSGLIGGGSSGTVTLNIGSGDGITVNADNVTVDSSVVRTSGTQTLAGNKTLTGSTQIDSLNINGAYSFPTADGTINQVLTTNGSGTLAFQPVSAIGLTSVTGGDGLTATVGVGTTELDVVGGYGITVNADDIEVANSDIRGLFSAGGDLSYNSTTGEFSFTNDAGDIEGVTAGTYLTGGGTSGTVSLDVNVGAVSNGATTIPTGDHVYDFVIGQGYSTTTGTVTSVSGGNGLTGSVTTSGSLNVGAGNYVIVNANDVAVDATSTNTANKVVARDGSGNFAAGTITATATKAQYADLAENYEADSDYEPGTVLILGGDKEVTVTDEPGSFKAMGVVSTDPAHLMNVDCEGEHVVAVALRGRIPCKVAGTCKKGDVLITSDTPGHAMVAGDPKLLSPLQIIGRALEHKTSAAPGVVEIIV